MGTVNFSSSDDVVVPTNNGTTYRGLGSPDIYILSNAIKANAKITIVDTAGLNRIQLIEGLSITSSKFAASALQLTLSNGAVITVNGANNFIFELGSNATTGEIAESNTFSEFASIMGVETLPTSGAASGSSNITVGKNSLNSSGSRTFSLTKDTNSVAEGNEVTFTITASSPVSSDTSFSWTAAGDTNDSTVNAAVNADIETLSGTALISSGSSSVTFKVKITNDSEGEPLEGVKVNVFDKDSSLIGSSIFLIENDEGDSSSTSDLKGTDGDDDLTLTSGNDNYEPTSGSDTVNGGDGEDTLIVLRGTQIIKSKDVFGVYTGTIDKTYFSIKLEGESEWTAAYNFEKIQIKGEDNFTLADDYISQTRWDVGSLEINDIKVENNLTKSINLSDSFWTYNYDTTMEYSIDFSNDKVSDQITLSGSNLSFEGGTGGEIYTVIITVKGTQKFPDNWIADNDEFNYDEQTFTVKLSDDDYIAVNASSNTTPSTSSLTKISVTEDIRGGVLLDLTSLNIDEGSIKIKSWGRDSNYSNDYFSDYFYLDEKVLKLKDDVIFNTDRDEITRLDSGFYYPNATSGEFDIVFDYESNGTNKRHTVKITEFIDTIYGSGLYGDGNYITSSDDDFSYSSDSDIKSLQSPTKWINTSSNSSEIIEIFYSFVTTDSKYIRETSDSGKYRSTDEDDTILDPTNEFKDAVKEILANTSSIFKLKFTELTGDNVDKASLRFVLWDSPTADAAGYAYIPLNLASFVFILKPSDSDYSKGSFTYGTIRHEIGHALGLAHPFEGDNLINSEFNSLLYTVMSYQAIYDTIEVNPYDNEDSGSYIIDRSSGDTIDPNDWAMYDIEALKYLYGIRLGYNSGDDTYSFTSEANVQTIHDLGGYDTIDLSGSSADNDLKSFQINLGGGAVFQAGDVKLTWSGSQDQTGQVFTTSFDTEIEKFIGSEGIDKVNLGPTSDTVITNGGDDEIWNIGTYKSLSSIKADAGSGDDNVYVYVYSEELTSLIDIDGGFGYDRLFIFSNIEEHDLSLYMRYFDNFEFYIFISDEPQTIIVDSEDFITTSSGLLTIGGGPEDTLILPEGTVQDTNEDDINYDYYEFEDIKIAVSENLSDNLLIG